MTNILSMSVYQFTNGESRARKACLRVKNEMDIRVHASPPFIIINAASASFSHDALYLGTFYGRQGGCGGCVQAFQEPEET